MIKVSIFSFPIFGDFNGLLANSALLAAYIDAASKKKCGKMTPQFFFVNYISIQVQLSLDVFFFS